jgi:O-antigen/teichoic acid export membrane protein
MGESTLKEKTSKGLFWGGMSSGIQQLLSVIFGIFLARSLSPDDYGLVGMLAVFSVLAQNLQDGGFVSALINRPVYRREDYNAVFWLSVTISVVCYIILFLAAPLISRFFHQPVLTKLARWTFLCFLFSGIGTAPRAFLSKHLKIKQMAISGIVAVLLSGVIGVYLALRGHAYWALVVQSLVMVGLTNLGYCFFSDWKPSFQFSLQPIREMYRYALPLLFTGLFTMANNYLMTVILGRKYSAEQTGYYTQANKWATMGGSVLNGMVASVAQPVLASVVDERERHLRVFRKLIRFTAFVSFPAMFGLGLIAPEFILLALSPKWTESIIMLQVLCVSGAFVPLITVCYQQVLSQGNSRIFMGVHLALFIALAGTTFLLYPLGILAMLIGVSAVNILWILVWVFFVRRETGYTYGNLGSDLLPFLGITIAVMVATYFITLGIANMIVRLVAKILVAVVLYLLIMWLTKSVTFRESLQFIFKKNNRIQS